MLLEYWKRFLHIKHPHIKYKQWMGIWIASGEQCKNSIISESWLRGQKTKGTENERDNLDCYFRIFDFSKLQ